MRALLALALVLAAPFAAAVVPLPQDTDGDDVPDAWAGGADLPATCAGEACVAAAASLEVVPGRSGLPQLHRHEGFAEATAGDCAAACAAARQETFYDQPPEASPTITLHGIPDGGATGGATLRAGAARVDLTTRATDTDRNNNTHTSAQAPHAAGPLEGEAGATSAVLVLLHHDRGLPHTRLAYLAPYAAQCLAGAGCAGVFLNQTYYHHDADDDVVHEQHRVGGDHRASATCGAGCDPEAAMAYDGGFLLEDSFFIIEPPSGVRGDAQLGLAAAPPLVALPPLREEARFAFAARDPDRDFGLNEAYAEGCALDRCVGGP